jgi:hypothetical protein
MALQNLNRDLQTIFDQIVGKTGKDKYRTFMNFYNHEFKVTKKDAIEQLKAITARPESAQGVNPKGSEWQEGQKVFASDDAEIQKAIRETATALIAEYKNSITSKNRDIKSKTQVKVGDFYLKSSSKDEVVLAVDLDSPGQGNAYNAIKKVKTEVSKKVFETPDTPGNKLFKLLLSAGRVRTYNSGKTYEASALYDIGHREAIGQYKAGALQAGIKSVTDRGGYYDNNGTEEAVDIGDVTSAVGAKFEELATVANGITIIGVDEFIVFKGTQMVQKPQSTFRVLTDLETQYSNQVEDIQEKGAGTGGAAQAQSKKLLEITKEIQNIVQEAIAKTPKENVSRLGSDSFLDALAKGIVLSPEMKRLYKKGAARNLTKWKGALKNRKNKSRPFKDTKSKSGVVKHNVLAGGLAASSKRIRANKPVEKGAGTENKDYRDALVARTFINSRLTKQVQRNMGRPALDNVTGRFAQSVNVVNANALGTHLHMDYTYQQDPYRVFENAGQYSSGYDPRPLIEKSIRELAAAKLETKFTLRRV